MRNVKRILLIFALFGFISAAGSSNEPYSNNAVNQDPINFEVFPNPVLGDEFNISSEVEVTEVTLLNILGQPVMNQKFVGETNINISFEARDKGLFIVQIKTIDGRVATKRVLFK